jgi:hypothetical protein
MTIFGVEMLGGVLELGMYGVWITFMLLVWVYVRL